MHPLPSGRAAVIALATIAVLVAGCGATASSTPLATGGQAAGGQATIGPSATSGEPSGSAPSAGPSSGGATSFDPTGQTVQATVAVTGFAAPLDVANAGDGSGRLFVAEQDGKIRIVKDGTILEPAFL